MPANFEGYCIRCHNIDRAYFMSKFNCDYICYACREAERNHPMYKEAEESELQAYLTGNRHFVGIATEHPEMITDLYQKEKE